MLLSLIIVSFLSFDFLSGDGEHHLQTNLHRWVSHTHTHTHTHVNTHTHVDTSLSSSSSSSLSFLTLFPHFLSPPEARTMPRTFNNSGSKFMTSVTQRPSAHLTLRDTSSQGETLCVSQWGWMEVLLPGREGKKNSVSNSRFSVRLAWTRIQSFNRAAFPGIPTVIGPNGSDSDSEMGHGAEGCEGQKDVSVTLQTVLS